MVISADRKYHFGLIIQTQGGKTMSRVLLALIMILLSPILCADDSITLQQRLTTAIHKLADELQPVRPVKLAINSLIDKSNGCCSPFSLRLWQSLERAITQESRFILVSKRGVKFRAYYLDGKYLSQGNGILLTCACRDYREKLIKRFTVAVPDGIGATAAMSPPNLNSIADAAHTDVIHNKSCGDLRIRMTTERGEKGACYRHGELLKLEIEASHRCYLYLYYIQANGATIQIFPNQMHRHNLIEANKVYTIPEANWPFDLEIDCSETAGMEIIKAVASLQPIPEMPGELIGGILRGILIKPRQIIANSRRQPIAEASCTILTVR